MLAFVYKSLRKPDAYVYLRERDAFSLMPADVAAPLGRLQFVLELELHEGRKLARTDAAVVRRNLAARGFHLQLPPEVLDPLVAGGVGES
ncbi:MAG TPA: YcgL domain-containing protein [Arenimonas sp.]|nr:YcgL domain-containing protein [Arenimonas sp.]